MTHKKKSVAIIGGGPAGIMAAAQLDENYFDVSIYEKNVALGRKFLVAGDGGLNITHSEPNNDFISKYTPASFFEPIINSFANNDLRHWLSSIGVETYMGTSKRIFPVKGTKPIDVLNAFIEVLKKKKVTIFCKHQWKGWEGEHLLFSTADVDLKTKADIVILAMGGSSWRVTGSDGSWTSHLTDKGIEIIPFQSSNCAFEIKWPKEIIEEAEGNHLKNISLDCQDTKKMGEIVITRFGLEGGAIYALSNCIRQQLTLLGEAKVNIDLKPSLPVKEIKLRLQNRGHKSIIQCLINDVNLPDAAVTLIKHYSNKEEFTNPERLAEKIKSFTVTITGTAPVDEAISTTGGVALQEIDTFFQIKKLPNHYVVGEMLDWDAPTGGYLLQGCFSMGHFLAGHLNQKYQSR